MTPTPKIEPEEEQLPAAHSLRDAANTDNTREGYAAMNDVSRDSEIAKAAVEHPVDDHHAISHLAYQYYLDRGGEDGSAEDDWCRAEQEIRSRNAR